jgi:hypothetical protein
MPMVLRVGIAKPNMNIMKGIFQFILCQFLLSLFAHRGAAQPLSASQREGEFDKIISEQFKPNETGCVALVAEQGKIIYKKAFGMANIELNVPMKTDSDQYFAIDGEREIDTAG